MRTTIGRMVLLAASMGAAAHLLPWSSAGVSGARSHVVDSDRTHVRSPLADMAWLAGSWHLERPNEYLDERWSPPVGNSMVGHFRWVRGDTLWLTEMLSITEEDGEVIFRLRHFSSRMKPWEEPDDAFSYRLTEREPGRVAFVIAVPRAGRPDRFIYEAIPGDSLLVRLEGEQGGEPSVQEFRYGPAGTQ